MNIRPIFLRLHITVAVCVLGCLHEAVGGSACPEDVVTALFVCLAPLRGPDASQLVTAGEDVEAVRDRCRDGSFPSAISCVEILLRRCRHSTHLPLLRDLTDVTRMEKSFGFFCDNVDLYANNRDCLVKEDTSIQSCLLMQSHTFYHPPTAVNNKAEEVEQICSFFREMTRCIDQPVRYYCAEDLADVLVEFMSGLTPPVCTPYSLNQGSPVTSTSQAVSVFIVGLIQFLLRIR